MKKHLTIALLFLATVSFAQTKKELDEKIKERSYTSSTGWIIKEGDTVKLGVGSLPNHMFGFIYRSPVNAWKMLAGSSGHETSDDGYNKVYLRSDQARQVIIKNFFVNGTKRGGYTIMAKVGVGDIANYWLEVESAVQSGEILPPGAYGVSIKNNNINSPAPVVQASQVSVADEIKKLKDLLDSGAITQAEYDAQKKKLLNQ